MPADPPGWTVRASDVDGARRADGPGVGEPDASTSRERLRVHDEAASILGGYSNVVSRWNAEIRPVVIGGRDSGAARLAHETIAEVVSQTGLALAPLRHAATDVESYLDAARATPGYRLTPCEPADRATCANFVVLLADLDAMRELADAVPLRAVYRRSLDEPETDDRTTDERTVGARAAGGRTADGRIVDERAVGERAGDVAPGDDVHCFFAPFQNAGREIVRAFVFVQADLPPALRRTCLQEEIYQAFGLFNDVSGSRYFSFDNRVQPKRVTAFDRALLASVYAPEGRPGEPVFAVVARFARRLDAIAPEPDPATR